MRAHLLQYDIQWEDKPANHAIVSQMLADCAPEAGDLVVLPEMFDTGFSLNVDITNDDDGASLGFIKQIAEKYRVYVQGAQSIRREGHKALNRATIANPTGEVVCKYDKVHPFSFGREGERFMGGTGLAQYQWGSGEGAMRVAPAVCYDLRFPELFRAAMIRGAEVFALGANWPAPRTDHWRTLAIARAIENQAYVFAVNRCGSDPHLAYEGNSIAIAPDGRILGEAGSEAVVVSVEADRGELWSWRGKFPALRDRRAALYAGWGLGYDSGPGPRISTES